jgi:predicted anti-sigma-YlaC factor YlaD
MGCEQIREILSAQLDNEDLPGEAAAADTHLATCARCRRWLDDAAAVTRLARIRLPLPDMGIPDTVLDAAPGRGRTRLVAWLRVLLGGVGLVQILAAVAQAATPAMAGMAMSGHAEGASPDHLLHESAAWNLAIGAGFMYIAARRARPAGVVPILTVFVVTLSALSLDDLLAGAVSSGRLASHVLLLAGYAIVVALSRPRLRSDDPPTGTARRHPPRWRLPSVDDNVVDLPRRLRGQPTAHSNHRAA